MRMLPKKILAISALVMSVLSMNVDAADEDLWGDDAWADDWEEEESNWLWGGFIEAAYGQRLQNDPLFESKQTLNEWRAHLESDYTGESVDVSFRGDTWYDDVVDKQQLDIRELNLSFSVWGNTDIKIGRQIVTWGTGDLVFLNDLFPKDWKSFFSGREDTYLKAPSDALRFTSYFDALNLDVVWTPRFNEDRYIDGERFSFFNPMLGQNIGGQDLINPLEPDNSLGNSELAIRVYKTIDGTEYALYGYEGFDKQPVGLTNSLQPTFHKKNIFGASIRGSAWGGLYNIEIAQHHAKEDSRGTNPLIKNSEWRFLAGYETEVVARLTLGLQYYLEWTKDYNNLIQNSATPQFEGDEKRHLVTSRLTYRTEKDKWVWSLFAFYSPSDEDSYLRPSVTYRLDDEWQFSAGANIFSGKDRHTFFGQFEDASNAYLRVRYSF